MYKSIRFLVIFSSILLMTSCGSLKKAEQFGKLSEDLSESFSALSDDIYFSCLRKSRYNSRRFPGIIEKRKTNDQRCEVNYQPVARNVKNANFVLIGYVGAIGTLATNRPGFFRPNIDRLKKSLTEVNNQLPILEINSINSNAITSGFNILNLLSDIFTASFRYSNTKTAVVCTNKDIQEYIPYLKEITEKGYIPLVESERQVVNEYFRDLTPPAVSASNLSDRESSYNLSENYNNAIDQIIKRKRAAAAYVEILEETASTHLLIANEFLGDSSKNTEKRERKCNKFFEEGKRVREKNKTSNLDVPSITASSKEKTERIEKILDRYVSRVNLLNQNMNEAFLR